MGPKLRIIFIQSDIVLGIADQCPGLNLTVSEKDYLILLRRNKDASSRKGKLRFFDLNGRMLAEENWMTGASELQHSTVGFPPGLMIRYQDEKFSSSFFHRPSRR